MRLAAIDIGSNSLRCTIVDVPVGGRRSTLDEERAYVRLGRGTAETGRLADDAMDEAVAAIGRMLRIAREFDVTTVRAIATAAVRDASNGPGFARRLRDELGLEVEVVTGEQEGRLALLSAVDSLALEGDIAVLDVGGGSAEIVRADGREIASVTSLPLGAVVLSDRFRTGDPIPAESRKALTRYVREALEDALPDAPAPGRLIGSGGTVTTLAAMAAAKRSPGLVSIHGFEMTLKEVGGLRETLVKSTSAERAAMKGMSQGRVDVIAAGAVVIHEAMRALGARHITANARGMREGIIVDTVERELGFVPVSDPMRSVRDFARQCRADVPHAEQVRRLVLRLFDVLAPALGLDPDARPLLEAAALLHDVGYHISFEKHHKHSFHLISHAELPGFSANERRVIAGIARYHSHAMPKPGHEAMQDLADSERETVSHLASLLRIADGLDRSRGQNVEHIDLELDDEKLVIRLEGSGPMDVEVYGATHKSDLFQREWGRRVEIVEP